MTTPPERPERSDKSAARPPGVLTASSGRCAFEDGAACRPFRIVEYPSLGSTNDEARRLLQEGVIREPTLILADHQTAGRGTRGRTWISPHGTGIYMSLVHPLEEGFCPVTAAWTRAAAVGCVEGLRCFGNVPAVIRPPNDMYANGRKLGGILIEAVVRGEHLEAVVTGVGVNVTRAPTLNDARSAEAACLADVVHPANQPLPAIRELALHLARHVDVWYRRILTGTSTDIDTAFMTYQRPPG